MELAGQLPFSSSTLLEDRYRIERTIGEGASGIVVLARDTQLGDQAIALKFLHSHLLFSEASFSRFRHEIRITMDLNHPNILQTYGLGRHSESCIYLKMEYVDGNTLAAAILKDGVPPLSRTICILRDLASALEYAHRRGVIHRERKPENILMDAEQRPRIADFGLAQMIRLEARLTGYGEILGTPYYMSPEQLRSEAVDSRSDMYSFGILAYELLSGTRPFEADSFLALAELHLEAPLPRLAAPAWLEQLVRRCTEKNRSDRYVSMQEVLDVLDVHCEVEPLTAKSSLSLLRKVEQPAGSSGREAVWQYRAKRYLKHSSLLSLCILLLSLLAVPRINNGAIWRYNAATLFIERHLGKKSVLLRTLFNTPLEMEYPSALFAVDSRGYVEKDFTRPYLVNGYNPNVISPLTGRYPFSTPLITGEREEVQYYIAAGADPNLIDRHGLSALDYAIRTESFSLTTIQLLLDWGANPNHFAPGTEAPLVVAVEKNRIQAAIALVRDGGARVDVESVDNPPLLHLAVATASTEMVGLLLERGIPLDRKDEHGRTALEFAKSIEALPGMKEIHALLEAQQELRKDEDQSAMPK